MQGKFNWSLPSQVLGVEMIFYNIRSCFGTNTFSSFFTRLIKKNPVKMIYFMLNDARSESGRRMVWDLQEPSIYTTLIRFIDPHHHSRQGILDTSLSHSISSLCSVIRGLSCNGLIILIISITHKTHGDNTFINPYLRRNQDPLHHCRDSWYSAPYLRRTSDIS